MHIIIPIILFFAFVGTIIGEYYYIQSFIYSDADTNAKCSKIVGNKVGDPCGAWDTTIKSCRKGKITKGPDGKLSCTAPGSYGPVALAALIIILFVAFIVTLIKSIHHHTS